MIQLKSLATAASLAALILGPLAPLSRDFGAAPAFAKNGNGGGNAGNGGGNSGNKGGDSGNKGGNAAGKGGTSKGKGATPQVRAAATDTGSAVVAPTPETAPNAHGKMASELKGLNAYHASETAFANASPESQVGRIAAYRDAALATVAAGEAVAEAADALADATAALSESEAALAALDEAYSGRTVTEIDADIAALDPGAADYQSQLDALSAERAAAETFETERTALEGEVAANEAEVAEAETAVADAGTALADAEVVEGDALTTAANGRILSDPAIDFLRAELGL